MAALTTLLSGGWRISSISNVITKGFSNTITGSGFQQSEYVILPNVSEFVVSVAQFSVGNGIFLTATNTLRLNFSGVGSGVSAASAGVIQFKEAFYLMSTSGGLPSGLHLSNSGSDSSVLQVLLIT